MTGVKRILTMVMAAAVLLAALHVALAHDLANTASSAVAASARTFTDDGGSSPMGSDRDSGDDHCFFCQILTHAIESAAPAPAPASAQATPGRPPCQLPRPALAALRLRPPQAA